MRIVVDTSVIIAVIAGESEKELLIRRTVGAELMAPESLYWEVGNALSAQMKRGRLLRAQVPVLLRAYNQIPVQFVEVSLEAALEIAGDLGTYAYDAYMLAAALKYRVPLLTLDRGLVAAAERAGVDVLEV
ncbi:MAG: type II toxin-antitoxin system VapC family toxin [Gemmatimonadota bacterium]|nr:type II toxin-antitoxin system VapC family toxin [Gemmatimonadota bacterium]